MRLLDWLRRGTYVEPLAAWEVRALEEYAEEGERLSMEQYDNKLPLEAEGFWSRNGARL